MPSDPPGVTIGLVGCGKQSRKHLSGLLDAGADVVVADQDSSLAEQVAREFAVNWRPSVDDLLNDDRICGIDVCTPTESHMPLITAAISARKAFFVEKPLAASAEDAWSLHRKTVETGVPGMVGFVYRYSPVFVAGAEVMSRSNGPTNGLGNPLIVNARIGGSGSHQSWKHLKSHSGGALNEMLVHMIDLCVWYFGSLSEARLLESECRLPERLIRGETVSCDAEDYVVASFRDSSGAFILCQADLISNRFQQYFEVQATNGNFFGSITDDIGSYYEMDGPDRGREVITPSSENLYIAQMRDFVRMSSDWTYETRSSLEDAAHVLDLIEELRSQERDGTNFSRR